MTRNLLFIEAFKLFKRSRAWVGPVLVFLLIIISFPLTLDINSDNPPQIYLSFIWISTLLVTMLGTELIFSEDFEDGTLEQYAVNNKLIEIVFYKILVHWALIGIPLAFVAFLFILSLNISIHISSIALLCLVISNLIFINFFSLGNALSLKKGSILGLLITIPFLIPVLIVLGKITTSTLLGLSLVGHLSLLVGVMILVASFIPFIISFILRTHLE
jgi:heme exporter protein B